MLLRWVKVRLTAPAFREARSLTFAVLLCAATRMYVVDQRTVSPASLCLVCVLSVGVQRKHILVQQVIQAV